MRNKKQATDISIRVFHGVTTRGSRCGKKQKHNHQELRTMVKGWENKIGSEAIVVGESNSSIKKHTKQTQPQVRRGANDESWGKPTSRWSGGVEVKKTKLQSQS